MTPLETLQKYGLKTDVPSIKERLSNSSHYDIVYQSLRQKAESLHIDEAVISLLAKSLRDADLALLCSLAEKGERYEKAVKKHREELEPHRHTDVCAPYAIRELDEIITELEGDPR